MLIDKYERMSYCKKIKKGGLTNMTFVSLESTDTPINYSDESSAFAYSNEFIQEVVSEINQAIINNNSVSMRIETSSMSYDHTINTKITDCKHSINSIFFRFIHFN